MGRRCVSCSAGVRISLGISQFMAESSGNFSKVSKVEILQSVWVLLKLSPGASKTGRLENYVYLCIHVYACIWKSENIYANNCCGNPSYQKYLFCLVFALFVSFLLLTSSTLWWFLWNNSHTLGYRQKSHTCSCTQRGRKQRSRALKPHEQLQWKKPWYLCFLMAWVVFDLGIFWMQKQCYWAEEINCTMHFKRLCRRSAGRTKSAAELDLQHSFFLLFPGPSLWQFSLQH